MSERTPADDRGKPLRLGPLEQQVMDALWDEGPLSIRAVITHLGAQHAYTTIATVLGNLERKRVVAPQREGRAVTYAARCTRERHAARLMEEALATSQDRATTILHFVDSITDRDLERLREYLARHQGRP